MDEFATLAGNPDADRTHTPIKMNLEVGGGDLVKTAVPRIDLFNPPDVNGTDELRELHPNKGPMFTQTFRGLQNHGPTHWRGDRVDGFYGLDSSAQGDPPYDARHAFKNFIVAFEGLVGRDDVITDAEMTSFADFAMNMLMPPNPIRNLDNSLTADLVVLPLVGVTPMPAPVTDAVQSAPGVSAASPILFEPGLMQTSVTFVTGVDPVGAPQVLNLDMLEGYVTALDWRGSGSRSSRSRGSRSEGSSCLPRCQVSSPAYFPARRASRIEVLEALRTL